MGSSFRKEIKNLLREVSIPTGDRLRLPQEPEVNESIIQELKSIRPENIEINVKGDDGYAVVYLDVVPQISKDISDAIVLNIQLLGEEEPQLYQPHISIHKKIQGLGLATKIYEAVINEFGHLYSGSGRRQSGIASKIWQKLDQRPGIDCELESDYNLCVSNQNPSKEEIMKKARGRD